MNLKITTILVLFTGLVSFSFAQKIKGNGRIASEDRSVSSFHSVQISGAFEVDLSQRGRSHVIIEADDNLLDRIETRVENGVLIVKTKKGWSISNAKKMKLSISNNEFRSLKISGAVDLNGIGTISGEELQLHVSGAGDIDLDVSYNELAAHISGAGSLNLVGNAYNADFDISGAGNIKAYDLKTDYMDIDLSGAGSAQVNAEEELDVNISGMGSVSYYGSPQVRKRISGLGSLSRK